MPDTTAEDVTEALERLIEAVVVSGPPFKCVFRGDDEAGHAQRDAMRVTTVVPVSDKRVDKRSGGSCYRLLTVATGSQYHRSRLTRRVMLADGLVLEDAFRHAVAGLAALAEPVTIHSARIIDGPRYDMATGLNATKAMTAFVLELEYHTAGA